jgi:hypothetical protein
MHHNHFWTRMHLKFWHNVYLTKILTTTKLHYQLLCITCYFSILHYEFKVIGSHTTFVRWQVSPIKVATSRWCHVPVATVISVGTGEVTQSSPLLPWSIKIPKQMINIYTTIIHQKSVPKAKHIYRQPLYIKSQYQKLNIYTTIIQYT